MLYQACYTSNTSGVFKAFHNGWGGQTKTALYRILSRFELKPAVFCDNHQENVVTRMDATELAAKMKEAGEVVDRASRISIPPTISTPTAATTTS